MKAVAVDIASIVRRCFCCGRTRHRYTQINTKLEAEKNVMTTPSREPFTNYVSTILTIFLKLVLDLTNLFSIFTKLGPFAKLAFG